MFADDLFQPPFGITRLGWHNGFAVSVVQKFAVFLFFDVAVMVFDKKIFA